MQGNGKDFNKNIYPTKLGASVPQPLPYRNTAPITMSTKKSFHNSGGNSNSFCNNNKQNNNRFRQQVPN